MAGPDTRAGAAVTAHGSPRSAVEIGGIEIVLPGNEIVLPGNADQREQRIAAGIGRLADWLVSANAQLGNTGRFTLPFDKRTLASRLGITPENLSRNLRALAGRGVVIHGRDVTLKDPEGLADLARAAPVGDEAEP